MAAVHSVYGEIVDQLASPESYKDLSNPDILHLIPRLRYPEVSGHDVDQQHFILLGSHHINNPNHWYYPIAGKIFKAWEGATRGKPRSLVAEGDPELWRRGETTSEAIRQHYGEVGLLCLIAENYDIPIVSGEPLNYGEIAQLMLEFPPEEVLLYYGIISIPLLNRMQVHSKPKPSLDEYMERQVFPSYMRKLGKLALTLPVSHPLRGFEFTPHNFKTLYKTHFGANPEAGNEALNEFYLKITSAEMHETAFASQAIARVALRRRELRDGYLGALYNNLWYEQGLNIFSWYGCHHTHSLDPYLGQFGIKEVLPQEYQELTTSHTESGYLIAPLRLNHYRSAANQSLLRRRLQASREANRKWAIQLQQGLNQPLPRPPVGELALPPQFIDPRIDCPQQPLAIAIKEYFSAKAQQPPGGDDYIRYLTQPLPRWRDAFFALLSDLEEYGDWISEPLTAPYENLDSFVQSTSIKEAIFDGLFDGQRNLSDLFDKDDPNRSTLMAACARLVLSFCGEPSDNRQFNQCALELYDKFATLAPDAQQAVVAFDTASKQLVSMHYRTYDVGIAGLTPVERLYHCLDLLEHEARTR